MDKALKQRLVGASVLVALAVVVLPMLLGGQPDSSQESRQIEIPPKPREFNVETRRFPIGDQSPEEPSVVPDEVRTRPALAPAETATPDMPSVDEPRAAEEESSADSPEDDLASTTNPAADAVPGSGEPIVNGGMPVETLETGEPPSVTSGSLPVEGRYLVQVASFSANGNATRLAGRLRDQGLPVLMDTTDSAAGTLHRVRIGPFEQRQQADQAIASLERQYSDLSPRVLDLRPGEEAQVTEPSDPLVHWVVQVGSFAEEANAESLVFQLRDAGYSAFSITVSGGAGTVRKVRVGPFVERDEAVRKAAEIKAGLGIDGLVMSAD